MKKFLKVLCVMLVLFVLASQSFAMTDEQESSCHKIIHTSAGAASASALVLAQAPGADNLALAGIIGAMVIELAKVFNVSLEKISATEVGVTVLTLYGGLIAVRTASQWCFGWIPFAGNSINAASMFALVEAIGWGTAYTFDSGDFSVLDSNSD